MFNKSARFRIIMYRLQTEKRTDRFNWLEIARLLPISITGIFDIAYAIQVKGKAND